MIKIKSLTRAQVKTIRELGLDVAGLTPAKDQQDSKNKSVRLLEWIFDNVYPELAKNDSIGYNELMDIAGKTYAKTYGREVEVKN